MFIKHYSLPQPQDSFFAQILYVNSTSRVTLYFNNFIEPLKVQLLVFTRDKKSMKRRFFAALQFCLILFQPTFCCEILISVKT